MKLESLQIINFRNFEDSGVIPYHGLTIFVGENGSGKTSTIDALAMLVDYRMPRPTSVEVRNLSEPVVVEGVFRAPSASESGSIGQLCVDDRITLRYVFYPTTGAVVYQAKCMKYLDDKFNTYRALNATDLKLFVRELGKSPGQTKDSNYEIVQAYLEESLLEIEEGYRDVAWGEVAVHMPILQRYSSSDYKSPENIVGKTLATIYRAHFYETEAETGAEELKQDFIQLKSDITMDLDSNINNQLKARLSKQLDGVSHVGGDFDIDFARGFALRNISITFENGSKKAIHELGEGHRKKATLAVLEWDAEVTASIEGKNVIKAYDEPDANLDFPAQRKIFNIINQDVTDNEHVSAIVCTHSLALIDRAPAKSINRVLQKEEKATVEYLTANDDDDIKMFLSEVSEVSGLRNSSIFYERAFMLVEGQSEEACMGLLYRTYTGRSMHEDGIVLINLETNGQWSNALKFLSANKKRCTVMLLDADTQEPGSGNPVTPKKLQDSGFDQYFLDRHCFFIGDKEFEDTYSDVDLARLANDEYSRTDGRPWSASDFASLRFEKKFSAEVVKALFLGGDIPVGKPELAYKMALRYDKDKISQNIVLRNLFDKLNEIISS